MLLEGARSYLLVSCCDAAGRNKCTVPKNKWAKWAALLWKWAQRAHRTVFSVSCIKKKKMRLLNSYFFLLLLLHLLFHAFRLWSFSSLLASFYYPRFRIQEATVSCSHHLIKWSLKLPLLSLSPHRSQLLIRSHFINPVSCTCSRLPLASANIQAVAPPSRLECNVAVWLWGSSEIMSINHISSLCQKTHSVQSESITFWSPTEIWAFKFDLKWESARSLNRATMH